jgi:competence protein ComEC
LTDGVVLETIWPPPGSNHATTNEASLVQVIKFGDFTALLTGDSTYQILETLVYNEPFDVLKLAHHGSKTGTSDLFLEKVRAGLAVVSAGKNNQYHHPHPSVLNALKKARLRYERTDEVGSIRIVTDGKETKIIN